MQHLTETNHHNEPVVTLSTKTLIQVQSKAESAR